MKSTYIFSRDLRRLYLILTEVRKRQALITVIEKSRQFACPVIIRFDWLS